MDEDHLEDHEVGVVGVGVEYEGWGEDDEGNEEDSDDSGTECETQDGEPEEFCGLQDDASWDVSDFIAL